MITGGYFGERISGTSPGYTNILNASGDYNVSGDGIFTSARVGTDSVGRSAKVGTWYNTGTNQFKNRDYASISPGAGDVTIYGLNIEAVAGDYVGIYDSGQFWGAAKSRWYKAGDGTVNEYTYSTYSSYWTSLYMEGTETAAGQPLIKRLGGVQYAALNRGVF